MQQVKDSSKNPEAMANFDELTSKEVTDITSSIICESVFITF